MPGVVCGSSGPANTGAIDPLLDLAELARSERLWYHIDGSYGAPAVLVDEFAWMGAAFAMADSMSLDPHKWLFAPADAGCLLVRDESALRRTFSAPSEYVEVTQTDSIERYAFFDHGLEMSRRFRGLKVWAILKARGRDGIRAAIAHDIALRGYLDRRIEEDPCLEALGSDLSISCFRFRPDDRSEGELTGLNRSILETIVREGRAYMSPTTLDGRYSLRVCIVNYRTTEADIDLLVDEVLRIGDLDSRG